MAQKEIIQVIPTTHWKPQNLMCNLNLLWSNVSKALKDPLLRGAVKGQSNIIGTLSTLKQYTQVLSKSEYK